jgi:hypothetical protein
MNASENPAEEPVSESVASENATDPAVADMIDEGAPPPVDETPVAAAPEVATVPVVVDEPAIEAELVAEPPVAETSRPEDPPVVAEDSPVVAEESPAAVETPAPHPQAVPDFSAAPAHPQAVAESEAPVADEPPAAVAAAPVAEEAPVVTEAAAVDADATEADAPAASEAQPADAEPVSDDEAAVALAARTAIVEEAEALAVSAEWSKTSAAYRDLLDRWRAAGSAGRERDNALWARFAGARDGFYAARNQHHAERSKLSAEAAERKKALIAECESLLEKSDPRAIGDGLDRLLEEWKQAGRAGAEDQTLWVQFRAARDRAFTLRRELVAVRQRNRETAKLAKEALIEAAAATPKDLDPEALQVALDEQMAAWKKVGSAGRDNDEALWLRFREARGAGFSRLRQVSQRKERETANAARSAEDAVEAAKRVAFSDAPVTHDDVAKLERQFERGSSAADEEARGQFTEAIARIKERATAAASAVPAANPFAAARNRQEQTVRDLESRIEQLKVTGLAREVARVEKRLVEERAKLERMAALIGG